MTTFVQSTERENTITVDGYSNAKTINGVMHDIARVMENICPDEASGFLTSGKKKHWRCYKSNQIKAVAVSL